MQDMTIDIKEFQQAVASLNKKLEEFAGSQDSYVTVGIHEDANDPEGGLTMASLGATHHFGADIDHPGGTPYGYSTEVDAERGVGRFLKKGTGFMVLGETEPHKIKIPARRWLDTGVISGIKQYEEALEDLQPETIADALEVVGIEASSATRTYMRDLRTPPNAPSTIKKKGSSNPLIDTGEMVQSVDYKVTTQRPSEGIE